MTMRRETMLDYGSKETMSPQRHLWLAVIFDPSSDIDIP